MRLLMLVVALVLAAGADALAQDQRALIRLEQAVFPAGTGPADDLELELDWRDGRFVTNAWAWLADRDLPVTIARGTLTPDRLTAEFTGAAGLAGTVDLHRTDNGWIGDYKVKAATGATASATDVSRGARPVRAVARLQPLPAKEPGAAGRPRLLFGPDELPRLRQHPLLPRLRELTAAGVGGDVGPGERLACPGFLAAGWALLARLDGDQAAAAKAAAAAQAATEQPRNVTGLAVAFDLAGDWWEPAVREAVAGKLRVAAPVPGPAGALAAVAMGDETAMALARRSLSRWIAGHVGNAGWGDGSTGYDEILELLAPALRALRRAGAAVDGSTPVRGPEPHFVFGGSRCFTVPAWRQGGAIGKVGLYALMAGGRPFDEQPGSNGWWPFVCDLSEAQWQPYLRWRAERDRYQPANPFHALYAMLALPAVPAADPAGKLPLSFEDRERGGYVLRSGWGDGAFVFTCEMAARTEAPAAYRRGHVSLTGLGREWIARPQVPFGVVTNLPPSRLNVVRVERAVVSDFQAAFPLYGGKLNRVRVAPDGSGSVSLNGYGWHGLVGKRDEQIEDLTAPYPGLARRTVGVDYSRRSGADAVVVIVEAPTYLGERTQTFELDLGGVGAGEVTCAGASFTVRPAGQQAVMRGTVLYPATAHATFVAGRLVVHRAKPQDNSAALLANNMEKTLTEIAAVFGAAKSKQAAAAAEEIEELLPGETADEVFAALQDRSQQAAELEQQHYALYAKMYKHTRSYPQHLKTAILAGNSDRAVRARQHWVVVLTVGAQTPPIVAAPLTEENLCTVGPLTVGYEEYLVKFGTPSAPSVMKKVRVAP
jgi:hypothetical protein